VYRVQRLVLKGVNTSVPGSALVSLLEASVEAPFRDAV